MRSLFALVLSFISFSTFVAAQNITLTLPEFESLLPACAATCLRNGVANASELGCPTTTNLTCFCSSPVFGGNVQNCTLTTCSTVNASSASQTYSNTCDVVSNADTGTSSPPSSGLSTGAQAGIGVGAAVVALGLIALAAFLFLRRRRRQRQTPAEELPAPLPSELPGDAKSAFGELSEDSKVEMPDTDTRRLELEDTPMKQELQGKQIYELPSHN